MLTIRGRAVVLLLTGLLLTGLLLSGDGGVDARGPTADAPASTTTARAPTASKDLWASAIVRAWTTAHDGALLGRVHSAGALAVRQLFLADGVPLFDIRARLVRRPDSGELAATFTDPTTGSTVDLRARFLRHTVFVQAAAWGQELGSCWLRLDPPELAGRPDQGFIATSQPYFALVGSIVDISLVKIPLTRIVALLPGRIQGLLDKVELVGDVVVDATASGDTVVLNIAGANIRNALQLLEHPPTQLMMVLNDLFVRVEVRVIEPFRVRPPAPSVQMSAADLEGGRCGAPA